MLFYNFIATRDSLANFSILYHLSNIVCFLANLSPGHGHPSLRSKRFFFDFWLRENWGERKKGEEKFPSSPPPSTPFLRSPQFSRGQKSKVFICVETLAMQAMVTLNMTSKHSNVAQGLASFHLILVTQNYPDFVGDPMLSHDIAIHVNTKVVKIMNNWCQVYYFVLWFALDKISDW